MNALINDYNEKSKPFYCAKAGLVDEIVDMPMMRNYIVAFTDSCYQNPESICPFHQMLLPRTIRDFRDLQEVRPAQRDRRMRRDPQMGSRHHIQSPYSGETIFLTERV